MQCSNWKWHCVETCFMLVWTWQIESRQRLRTRHCTGVVYKQHALRLHTTPAQTVSRRSIDLINYVHSLSRVHYGCWHNVGKFKINHSFEQTTTTTERTKEFYQRCLAFTTTVTKSCRMVGQSRVPRPFSAPLTRSQTCLYTGMFLIVQHRI